MSLRSILFCTRDHYLCHRSTPSQPDFVVAVKMNSSPKPRVGCLLGQSCERVGITREEKTQNFGRTPDSMKGFPVTAQNERSD